VFRRSGWIFLLLFGLALVGATAMNFILVNQARLALDEGILEPSAARSPAHHHLALVIPELSDSFFDGLVAGVQAAAARQDVALQTFRYRGDDPGEAEKTLQLCLTAHLDGVIFYSPDDGLARIRQLRAQAEGVILIPVGLQSPRDMGIGFIGASSLLQGVETGNQAGQRRGQAARVGLLLSPDEAVAPEDDPVYRGVLVALQSYPGSVLVKAARARQGIFSGEEAASALLKAYPAINVLICASAPITEGAAQVVVDQGRVGRVLILGTDESPTIDRLVKKGVIAASVVRDSGKMGTLAVEAFLRARAGAPFQTSVEVGFTVRQAQGAPK